MNKILEWFTKKRVLLFSVFFLFMYFLSYSYKVFNLPEAYVDFCCLDDRKLNLFLISLPLFLFSIIYFFYNKYNFKSWFKKTLIFIILYLVLYFIVPTQGDGYIWFQRETVAFFGSVLYFIFSIILIIYYSLKKN
jgi:hypothetical protein